MLDKEFFNQIFDSPAKSEPDFFKAMLDLTNSGLIIYDKDRRVIYYNKYFEKLFSLKKSILKQKRDQLFKHGEKFFGYKGELLFDPKKIEEEVYLKGDKANAYMTIKSDPPQRVEILFIPIKKRGKVLGMIARHRNVTDRVILAEKNKELKKAEKTLKRSHLILEKKVLERTSQLSKANFSLKNEIEYRKKIEKTMENEKRTFETIYNSTQDGLGVWKFFPTVF